MRGLWCTLYHVRARATARDYRGKIRRQKRGIAQERLDQLVSGIQRQVETLGDAEVSAKLIGEMVMDGLRQLDSVAYIRFASVYRDFSEAKDFEDFASAVQDAAKH
jgi:transcriptional repressor NrdR